MRTFEEIIESAESIMAEIDNEYRRRYHRRFKGFDEITAENEDHWSLELCHYYGEGGKHILFSLVAFHSTQFIQSGQFLGDYSRLFRLLGDDRDRYPTVDSTENPNAPKYTILLRPSEIEMLIDWVNQVFERDEGRGWGSEEFDAQEREEAIARLTKISQYKKR